MRKRYWLILGLAVIIVVTAAMYRPLRVFYPSLAGLRCTAERICIEDEERLEEAKQLVASAMENLDAKLSPLGYRPKVIFCSTQACFEAFGFRHASAQTRGAVATVVGPRGWVTHYLTHELIHQWQAAKIGSARFMLLPQWLREGMAYSLSDDPRETLAEPWQSHRVRFRDWFAHVDKSTLTQTLQEEATLSKWLKYKSFNDYSYGKTNKQ